MGRLNMFRIFHFRVVIFSVLFLSACSADADPKPYTLYRNSPVDEKIRIHWATFDAEESSLIYNMKNCMMAAAILNANVNELSKREGVLSNQSIGFWCEPGSYKDVGSIPASFKSAFPIDE